RRLRCSDVFFSSRRRHTRWPRDWSSDVCSSDLARGVNPEFSGYQGQMVKQADATMLYYPWGYATSPATARNNLNYYVPRTDPGEIGRASCRERVESGGDGGRVQNKRTATTTAVV